VSTVSDPFTDTPGTLLDAHAFPGGFAWTKTFSSNTNDNISIESGSRAFFDTASTDGEGAYYAPNAYPQAADYTVRVVLVWTGFPGGQYVDIIARDDGTGGPNNRYYARYNFDADEWELWKHAAGTDTKLTNSSAGMAGAATTYEFFLAGTSLTLKGDGSTIISSTDGDVTGAGRMGLAIPKGHNSTSATPLIDTFEADCTAGFATTPFTGGGGGPSPFILRSVRISPRRR